MAYQTRATRREDGGYDLHYGKGKKKVTAITKRDPANNRWFVDVVGHHKKLGDLKTAWGKWADARYTGSVCKTEGETADSAPPMPPVPMPPIPKRRRKGTILPIPPQGIEGLHLFEADPDGVHFKYPDTDTFHPDLVGKPTPLGMLLEIQAWHERYKDRVSEINHKIALTRIPGFNPFSFLRLMVDECIEREINDIKRENNHDE